MYNSSFRDCQPPMIIFDIAKFKNILKPNHRLLCFDVGQVKIGTALSDPSLMLASSYILMNLKKHKLNIDFFKNIIEKEKIYGLIVGYPLQMDGEKGNSCLMVDKFIKKYLEPLNQPIFLQDERLSTAAVNRYFKEMQLTRKQQEDINDVAAARYILQIVLDKLSNIKKEC